MMSVNDIIQRSLSVGRMWSYNEYIIVFDAPQSRNTSQSLGDMALPINSHMSRAKGVFIITDVVLSISINVKI